MEDCMSFAFSNCGSTIIQLHHLKKQKNKKKTEKETLAFICTEASHSEVVVRRVLCWIS